MTHSVIATAAVIAVTVPTSRVDVRTADDVFQACLNVAGSLKHRSAFLL